ncbi:MAG: type I-C CRISPR-associated protein Cas8c/Csd1 [Lentisphaerae bacterium]|nr:type I-C CRISPR-associated protein Cas8c/Csd1 [Lentisphaerota bacterium]
MILQALKEYYDRKADDPNSDIAPEGFEKKELPFLVVIKPDGQFVNLEDTREQVGKRLTGKAYLLPRSCVRTGSRSYEKTFLLWDHIGYLFRFSKTDGPDDRKKAVNQHQAWLNSLQALPNELKQDEGVAAILMFYETNGMEKVKATSNWSECVKLPSCNMSFRLAGDTLPIPCRPKVQEYVRSFVSQISENHDKKQETKTRIFAHCLITGQYGEIAKTHGRTPINKDTKSLVAFQKNSGYDSYGKVQCYNAPVCKSAEFAYTTALNTLLKSRSQRLQIATATTVFWSAKKSQFESVMPFFFSEPPRDDPDKYTDAVKALYDSIWNGTYVIPDDDTRFYVLGLSPNAARIAVRFWKVGTVKEIGTRLKRHVDDLAIIHAPGLNPALPMWKLLRSIAVREEDKNIPPNLGGDTMRSILEGLPYPQTLLQAAVRRIRAEHDITYPRAALIKACINRSTRFKNPTIKEELKVTLDPQNTNIGYRLGRLFASLEKIQTEANPGINATIRDKFYGAASSTPVTVFGNLMRLKNHHIAKLEHQGRRVFFEKLLGEILDGIDDFPPHLDMSDQGRFAIGYYHQTQSFYTPKKQ